MLQAGAITGFVSAFVEGPIDFFKSQIQVQIIRAKADPNYKREPHPHTFIHASLKLSIHSTPFLVRAQGLVTQRLWHDIIICTVCAAAFTTVSGAVRAAFQNNGLKGPFQGLGATIVRNTPANSVYLGSFEVLKQQFAKAYGCPCAASFTLPLSCICNMHLTSSNIVILNVYLIK